MSSNSNEELVSRYDTESLWYDESDLGTRCQACYGTGLDRYDDVDCLVCWGEGVLYGNV